MLICLIVIMHALPSEDMNKYCQEYINIILIQIITETQYLTFTNVKHYIYLISTRIRLFTCCSDLPTTYTTQFFQRFQ